jgi:hypothetical protein
MNGFIQNIIDRHMSTLGNISPRLPGRYEPAGTMGDLTGIVLGSYSDRQPETNFINEEKTTSRQPADPVGATKPPDPTGRINSKTRDNELPDTEFSIDRIPFAQKNFDIDTEHPGKEYGHAENKFSHRMPPEELINDDDKKPERKMDKEYIPVEATSIISPLIRTPSREDEKDLDRSVRSFGSQKQTENTRPLFLRQHVDSGPGNKTPVIKISIGRIEVRAISGTAPVKAKREPEKKPKISLDEYLNKRNSTQQ